MAEYIEQEKVWEMLHEIGGCGAEPESWADGWDKAIDAAINELEKMPAADVQEVKYGMWILQDKKYTKCSECELTRNIETQFAWNYCPNCGAKMNGKDGE